MLLVHRFKLLLLVFIQALSSVLVLLLIGLCCVFHYFFFPIFLGADLLFASFLSNFLLASFKDFMPCLFFGSPQPQVAHILFLLPGGRGVVDKVGVRAASSLSLCFSRCFLLLA